MRTRSWCLSAAVAVGLGLTGCGAGGPAAPTPHTTAATAGAATSAPSPSNPSPVPPSVPGSTAPEITVTGTVADGVEAGCRLLRAGSVTYLLIGDAAARVPATGRVTVRGRVDLGRATTCMQGIPLEVIEVRPG